MSDFAPDTSCSPDTNCPPWEIDSAPPLELGHEECAPPEFPEEFRFEPEILTTRAKRIVRAITGEDELRLVSQQKNGVHQRFILETVARLPKAKADDSKRIELTYERKKKGKLTVRPMDETEALRAFTDAVHARYPNGTTRSGKSFAICASIL